MLPKCSSIFRVFKYILGVFQEYIFFQGFFQVPGTVQTLVPKNPDNCNKV